MRARFRSAWPVPESGYATGVGGGSWPASGFSAWFTYTVWRATSIARLRAGERAGPAVRPYA